MAQSVANGTVRELAKAAGVKVPDIQAFMRRVMVSPEVIAKLRRAFESNGLVFIDEDAQGGGVGVRLCGPTDGGADRPGGHAGPATDVMNRMDADIAADRAKRR